MSDFALVPVDHQPDFENVSLVPVDHNPFSDEGVTQQAPTQLAQIPIQFPQTQPQAQQAQFQQPQTQTQPAQSTQAQTQPAQPQPPAGVGQPNVGASANNTQASEAGESWNPDTGNSGTSGPNQSAASTAAQDKSAYDWSRFNQPFGELKPTTSTPTQRIGYQAADALIAAGMQPYDANHLTSGIGGLLGWTPLGLVGSALDLIDAKRRDDLPGVAAAALGMIPGARGVGRVVAEEAGAGLRALRGAVRRSPASRAAEKGYPGVGTTPNGGPTFVGTDHVYPATEGQRSVVRIKLTGSRRKDEDLANEWGGFAQTPDGYMWHHVDDFDPQSGEASLELIDQGAHIATYPHTGSVAQYEKHHGVRYKR
jgi:hypothetical protein